MHTRNHPCKISQLNSLFTYHLLEISLFHVHTFIPFQLFIIHFKQTSNYLKLQLIKEPHTVWLLWDPSSAKSLYSDTAAFTFWGPLYPKSISAASRSITFWLCFSAASRRRWWFLVQNRHISDLISHVSLSHIYIM